MFCVKSVKFHTFDMIKNQSPKTVSKMSILTQKNVNFDIFDTFDMKLPPSTDPKICVKNVNFDTKNVNFDTFDTFDIQVSFPLSSLSNGPA